MVADPSLELTIDVARGTVEAPAAGLAGSFPLDEFTRDRLLNGWDDIGLTLRHGDDISAYERQPLAVDADGLTGLTTALSCQGLTAARPAGWSVAQ